MKKILLVAFSFFGCTMVWGQDPELVRKAETGDIKAQGELARYYYLATGGVKEEDYNKAAHWAKLAAEAGDAEAQDILAFFYGYGKGGLPKNRELAFDLAHKSAAQGCISAMFTLGLLYKGTNAQEAIYWFKKYMDACYQVDGGENEMAAMHLRDLGVTYHPGSGSDYTASRSSSSSSSSSSLNSSSSDLLYSGLYTKSAQGYCVETGMYTDPLPNDFEISVEIYDDHIVVLSDRYDYVSTSDGWKIYGGEANFLGSVEYYKVNPLNYEMSYYMVTSNPYMGGSNTFTYAMKKGSTKFQKNANSGHSSGYNSNGGDYSSGGSGTTSRTYETSCLQCGGSGKCSTCNGTHRYINPLTNKYVTCPNCGTDGRCRSCGGTGKKTKTVR